MAQLHKINVSLSEGQKRKLLDFYPEYREILDDFFSE